MLALAMSSAIPLEVLGTNPLGLSFLLLFGFLFFLQFLSMLSHRGAALVESLASVQLSSQSVKLPVVEEDVGSIN